MGTKQANIFSELTDSERRDKSQLRSQDFAKQDLIKYLSDNEAPWSDADKFEAEVERVKHADVVNGYSARNEIVKTLVKDSIYKHQTENTPMRLATDIDEEATKLWEEKARQEAFKLMQVDEKKYRNSVASRNEASDVLLESGAIQAALPHTLGAHHDDIQAQHSYNMTVPEIISNKAKEIGEYLNPKESEYFNQRFQDLQTPEDVQNAIREAPAEYIGIHKVYNNILAASAEKHLGAPREEGWIEGKLMTGGRVLSGIFGGGMRGLKDYRLKSLKDKSADGGLDDVFRGIVEFARGTGLGVINAGSPTSVYGIGGARESKQELEKYLARGPAIDKLQQYKTDLQAKGFLPKDEQLEADVETLNTEQITQNNNAITDLKGVYKSYVHDELVREGKTPVGEGFIDTQLQTTPEGSGNKLLEDLSQIALGGIIQPEGYVLKKLGKGLGKGLDLVRDTAYLGPKVDKAEALFRADAGIDKTVRLAKKAGMGDKEAELMRAELKFSRQEGSNAAHTVAQQLERDIGEATSKRATLDSIKEVYRAAKNGPRSAWEVVKKNSEQSHVLRAYAKEQMKTAYTEARVASMHDTLYKHNMGVASNSENYGPILAESIEAVTGIPQVVLTGDIATGYGRIIGQPGIKSVVLPKQMGYSIKELIAPSPSWTTNRIAEGAAPTAKFVEKSVANILKGAIFANDYVYQPALNTLKVLTIFSNPSTAVNNFLTNVKLTVVQEGKNALNPTALASASQSAITGALGRDLAPEITKKMAVSGFKHPTTLYDLDVAFKEAGGYAQARAHVGLTTTVGIGVTNTVGEVVSASALGTKQLNVAGDVAFKKIAFVNKLQSLGEITPDNIKLATMYMNDMTGNYQAMGSFFDRMANNTVAWYNWKSFYWVRTAKNIVNNPDAMAFLDQYSQYNRDQAEAKTDKNILLPGVLSNYQKKFQVLDNPKLQQQYTTSEDVEGYVGKRHEKLTSELDDFIKASTGQKAFSATPLPSRAFAIMMTGHDPITGQEIDVPGGDAAVRKGINTLPAPVIKSFMTTFKLAMENNDYPTMFSLLNQLAFMSSKQVWAPLISWAVGARVVESPDLGATYGIVQPDSRAWELGIASAKKRYNAENTTRNTDIIRQVTEVPNEAPELKE